MENYLMISGATGGLGSALVVECARRGYNLYLTDISEEGADFADCIAETYGVKARYKACDLTSSQARQELFNQLKSEGCQFWGLLNVAGLDNEGAFLEKTREQILRIIQVDVESTVDMTHAILGLRAHDRRFMLLNVCSLAAFFPMPYKATYAASKRFLVDFSCAIREEIRDFGSVTALCPAGLPTTPASMRKIFAQGFWGKMTTMDTQAVARKTIDCALRGKTLYIPGFLNCALQRLGSLIPPGVVAKFVGKRWRTAQNKVLGVAAGRKNLETT
jgi:short-subunit dehydrogenase